MAFGVCAPTGVGGGPGRRRFCGLRPQNQPARRPGPADGRARFARPPPPPARLRRAGRQLPAGVHANGIVCGGLLIARESGGSQWPGLPFGVCAPTDAGGGPGAGRRRFCGLRPQNQPARRPGPADGRARFARPPPPPARLRRPGRIVLRPQKREARRLPREHRNDSGTKTGITRCEDLGSCRKR